MLIDSNNQISSLVATQFPSFYNEEGPMFIAFVEAYFEWMQSENNPLYLARNILNYRDIDTTVDSFLVFFKNKYLSDIQFEDVSSKRQFIKNSLEFHRAKGTPRALNLFFQLVYGVPANVYYPGQDLFRLSQGSWVKPYYLEVTHFDTNINFVGKQIKGTKSGATAFVEKLVRRRVRSKYIDIFYISDIQNGDFQTTELIQYGSVVANLPVVIGSLAEVDIVAGGENFTVGEFVNIISPTGAQGVAVVSEVSDVTGIVDFNLKDGGFGYTVNAEILVSDKVLSLANVIVINTEINNTFIMFEQVNQPLAIINYTGLNGSISNGNIVEQYFGNGHVSGSGIVLTSDPANSTVGSLLVSVSQYPNGALTNLNSSSSFSLQGNSVTGIVATYQDQTATGIVIGSSGNLTFNCTNATGSFAVGEQIVQGNSQGTVISVGQSGLITTIQVINSDGTFQANAPILGQTSNAGAIVANYSSAVGIVNTVNSFELIAGNYIYGSGSNTQGSVTSVSRGQFANASVGSLLFPEQITLNFDLLHANNTGNVPYMAMFLDGHNSNVSGNGYGFPKGPATGYSGLIINSLTFNPTTIGVIGSLTNVNPGIDYTVNPFVIALEPQIYAAGKYDYVITINNPTRSFAQGEIVQQVVNYPNTVTLQISHAQDIETGQFIYQSNGTSNTATGLIQTAAITSNAGTLVVNTVTGTFVTTLPITAFNNSNTANVTSIDTTPYATLVQGLLQSGNSTTLEVKRISFADFAPGTNVAITGSSSNASAAIIAVEPNLNNNPIGLNANITANVITSPGSVESLTVVDSGFGYPNSQLATFQSIDQQRSGSGLLILKKQGQSQGYYTDQAGQLSSNSALFDGDFYQQYSYQVLTRLPFDTYSDVLKKTLHVAGTAAFGKVIFDSTVMATISAENYTVTPRTAIITAGGLAGSFALGDILIQANSSGTITQLPKAQLTAFINPLIGTTFTQGANSGIVSAVLSNTIYFSNLVGTITAANSTFYDTIRSTPTSIYYIQISSVASNTPATGSFQVGESVYQGSIGSQTANGIVLAANNNTIIFEYTSGLVAAGSRLIGLTSGGSANVTYYNGNTFQPGDNAYVQQLQIDYLNANGSFSLGDQMYQQSRITSSANVIFANTATGLVTFANATSMIVSNLFGSFANNRTIYSAAGANAHINHIWDNKIYYGLVVSANSTALVVANTPLMAANGITVYNSANVYAMIAAPAAIGNTISAGGITSPRNSLQITVTAGTFAAGLAQANTGNVTITTVKLVNL